MVIVLCVLRAGVQLCRTVLFIANSTRWRYASSGNVGRWRWLASALRCRGEARPAARRKPVRGNAARGCGAAPQALAALRSQVLPSRLPSQTDDNSFYILPSMMRLWFSGIIPRCHRGDLGSIPGGRTHLFWSLRRCGGKGKGTALLSVSTGLPRLG
jgi:hypothetical protein